MAFDGYFGVSNGFGRGRWWHRIVLGSVVHLSRGVYDTKLRALREDATGAEDVTFEDLTVEDAGDVVEFLYQCRCNDYYSIDSLELESNQIDSISLQTAAGPPEHSEIQATKEALTWAANHGHQQIQGQTDYANAVASLDLGANEKLLGTYSLLH
ncbi:hypothetical protein RJ639_018257 [Escallonia herrerae]|uniref:Uncharacterized protein n=1 Tax=Escallonia herrerae TaxID=1293975 RepID=A0AA88V986_9ASTE|nr:hypothetical protein RJ639_018257 [Escallonia herrerae]